MYIYIYRHQNTRRRDVRRRFCYVKTKKNEYVVSEQKWKKKNTTSNATQAHRTRQIVKPNTWHQTQNMRNYLFIRCTHTHRRHDDDDDGVWTAIKLRARIKKKKCCETIKGIWCGYISPNRSTAISDCWMFGFYRRGVTERLPAPPLCWTFSHISPVLFYHWPHDLTFSGWCLALFSLNSCFFFVAFFNVNSIHHPHLTRDTSLRENIFFNFILFFEFFVFVSVFIKPPSLCQIEFQHICADWFSLLSHGTLSIHSNEITIWF